MDLLPYEIRKNGYIYNLEKRGEKAMIYKQTCAEEGYVVGYEVFKRKIDKPKIVFGIELGEREIFPGNEDFGKWAWAVRTLERAEERFQNIEMGLDEQKEEE
jgi:hypothetical protein